jgi:uncharacterized protein
VNQSLAEDCFVTAGKAGTPLTDCVVIDAHAHLGPYGQIPYVDSTPEGLIWAMDRLGIDRAQVSATWGFQGEPRLGNDYLLEAMRKFPGRIAPYMSLRIGYPEGLLAEAERCYAAGMRAVKVYHNGDTYVRYNHAHYDALYGFANDRELPLLAHTWGADQLEHMRPGIEKYDRVKWMLAHTGAADVETYIEFAHEYPHVYLETCFSLAPRGMLERLVAEAPLPKLLWGSDQVFMSAAHQLGRVLFAQITPEQKRAILGENAALVFAG